jgi:hypothetical protein
MARNCSIVTLTILVVLSGMLRLDTPSRSLSRMQRASELARYNCASCRFEVLNVDAAAGGPNGFDSHLMRQSNSHRSGSLQSLRIKLQV